MPATTKRKREQHDQGMAAPQAHNFSHSSSFENQYLEGPSTEIDLAEALTQHNAGDIPQPSDSLQSNGQSASDTANAALHFGLGASGTSDSNFLVQTPGDNNDTAAEPNFELESPHPDTTSSFTAQLKGAAQAAASVSPPVPVKNDKTSTTPPASPGKDKDRAKVGTDEWQALRRNNHKEVERRRRETINDGIEALGKIVPGAERNKGSILQRAVMYISDLKERQSEMEQKNNLEKMMFEQAIAEMTASGDKLKAENGRLQEEVERWKRRAEGRE
ncbi:Transcriptional regulator CBF1 [Sphaceloma murrayae]|uniref:Transcriptional regulator CBF1 n=1 Tax=Sphaceloma murrayae TaxID=2082308 RepID=A0A2K1QH90_9PEZI|nr:Transcriptional regulator CBF1 [Sphaceloma murrayae]